MTSRETGYWMAALETLIEWGVDERQLFFGQWYFDLWETLRMEAVLKKNSDPRVGGCALQER